MPRQSILVHSYILISSSFSRSWWPLGVGGGQEEDEQPSLPCVKPTEPSRRSDWHITCVAWLQAHRRQEQKWHPWSSYLLDTSVWKMCNSFLTMSPHLTGLESLKAWHSNWAYCNVGIGKEERLFETIQRRDNSHSDAPPHPWVHCMASCRSSSDCVLSCRSCRRISSDSVLYCQHSLNWLHVLLSKL